MVKVTRPASVSHDRRDPRSIGGAHGVRHRSTVPGELPATAGEYSARALETEAFVMSLVVFRCSLGHFVGRGVAESQFVANEFCFSSR